MARKMQKLLSMVLALSMCMSLLSITALAEGEGESSGEETRAEFSAPAGENGDGEGTVKDPKITVTESSETKDGTTTTTTTKEWEGQDPKDPDDAEKPANPDGTETPEAPSTPATGPVTKVEGEETTVESTVTDSNGNTLKESGTVDGKETLTTTTTTTTTKNESSDKQSESSSVKGTESAPTESSQISDVNEGNKETSSDKMDAKSDVNFSNTFITVTPGTEGSQTVNGTVTDAQIGSVKETLGISGLDTDYTKNTDGTYTKTETTYVTDTDGKEQLDAAGNKIVAKTTTITVKPVYAKDQDGKDTKTIIGYTKTESTKELTDTTTDTSKGSMTKVENSTVTSDNGAATTITSKKVEKLPAKPDGKEPVTNTDGSVTTTTVEEIKVKLNEGDTEETVVGYKVSTVTTKDGKTVATTCKTTYGTVTTTTVTTQPRKTETDYKQTVTTTTTNVYAESEDISTAVVDPGEGKVTVSMGTVNVNTSRTDISSLQPDINGLKPTEGSVSTDKDLYGRSPDKPSSNKIQNYDGDYQYRFDGNYGLDSSILTKADSPTTGKQADTWWTHQFELSKNDSDEKFYAYCADFTTNAEEGSIYNMINVEDAAYFKDEYDADGKVTITGKEKAEKVRTIALNGYWGTASGTGSLTQLKQQLSAAGWATEDVEAITDGMALTATQAAIWKYGNSGSNGIKDGDVAGKTITSAHWDSSKGKYTTTTDSTATAKADLVNRLFKYLTSLDATSATENTALLNSDTIKGTTVDVKSTDSTNKTVTANLSFTLAITPSSKNENLVINIIQNGKTIGTKTLNQDCPFTAGENGNNVYTFENLILNNGEEITVKLEGVHTLDQGVYLYSAPTYSGSQTFVGVGEGKQTVDISTTLTINVTDPTSKMNTSGSTKEQTSTETSSATHTDTITKTDFFNTNTTTTETVDQTEWEWHEEWEKTYSYNGGSGDDDDDDDDVIIPGDDDDDDDDDDVIIPGDTPTTDIPSDLPAIDIPSDIPATNVPKTGDLSVLWYALSACSGLGLAGTALLGRKRRDDED